jgi:hypothetical protein
MAMTAPGHVASVAIVQSENGHSIYVWCPTIRGRQDQAGCQESIKRLVENVLRYAREGGAA